jgi:ribonucleotide reductase alpha subunit
MRRARSEKLCNGIALNPRQQVSSCFVSEERD